MNKAVRRIYNLCGRIHLGPVCVNGVKRGQPICEACGENVTQQDRVLIGRMWLQVRDMLSKYKVQ